MSMMTNVLLPTMILIDVIRNVWAETLHFCRSYFCTQCTRLL